MEKRLEGKRVAILVADGFEQVELTGPMEALEDAGAETQIVSPVEEEGAGLPPLRGGDLFPVGGPPAGGGPPGVGPLAPPGGVANPDQLRMNADAVAFVKA